MSGMFFIGGNGTETIRTNGNSEIFTINVETQPLGGILSNILETVDKVESIRADYNYPEIRDALKKKADAGIRVSALPDEPEGIIYNEALEEIIKMTKQPDFHYALAPYVLKNRFYQPYADDAGFIEIRKYINKCAEKFEYLSSEYFVNVFQYMDAHGISSCKRPSPVEKICDEALNERHYTEGIELLDDMQKLSEDKSAYHVYRFYECNDLFDICVASINELIIQKTLYAKCIHCGRMFVPPRANALYCEKLAPESNKATCRVYAKNQREMKVMQNKESKGLFRKTHMKLRNRTIRYPDNQEYKTALADFTNEAGKLAQLVETGKMPEEAFVDWLKKKHQE